MTPQSETTRLFNTACALINVYRTAKTVHPAHEPTAHTRANVADAHRWLDDYMATHHPDATALRHPRTGRVIWHRLDPRPNLIDLVVSVLAWPALHVPFFVVADQLPTMAVFVLEGGILIALGCLTIGQLARWDLYRKSKQNRIVP